MRTDDSRAIAIEGPHATLRVPDGPWNAPTWLIDRPMRFSASGAQSCAVDTCNGGAGRAEGDRPRTTDVLCVAHRRRLVKSAQNETLAEFIANQAGRPILQPRGANSRRLTFPPIEFKSVNAHLAHELRFIAATKINRLAWRSPHYLAQVLAAAVEYGAETGVSTLLDFPSTPKLASGTARARQMFPSHSGAQWRSLASALPGMVAILREATPDPWDSEIWRAADLGIGESQRTFLNHSWNVVTCEWLRIGLKAYARQHLVAGTRSWGTVRLYVRGGSILSKYMDTMDRHVDAEDVDRAYFQDFVAWVRRNPSKPVDIGAVTTLARLLTDMREMGVVPSLPSTVYLLRGENPNNRKRRPKPFPADIVERIDHMIATADDIPDDIRLMLRVYRAVGPRSSECLVLPRDSIRHVNGRGYSLEYHQSKTDSVRAVPISDDLGKDLAAHALSVAEFFGVDFPWLFPRLDQAPRMHTLVHYAGQPMPWPYKAFVSAVWALYRKHGIITSQITGETLTGAQLHRFRHTIATDLLNGGWSQHEVQKFLGHTSPTMMQAYAEIHDDTLHRKYTEFVEQSIDITGAQHRGSIDATATVERLRDRIIRSTLPNGYCTLPEKQNCDFAPSPCLSCKPFFRTTPTFLPIHVRQRDESLRQLDLARKEGRERSVEIHSRTVRSLDVIIGSLQAQVSEHEESIEEVG
jgi:integrase/recombinase XerD